MSLCDIDKDKEFSTLEKLAFKGIWNKEQQRKVWSVFNIGELLQKGEATEYYQRRLSDIMRVHAAVYESKNLPEKMDKATEAIMTYLEKYPTAIQNIPSQLRSKISE